MNLFSFLAAAIGPLALRIVAALSISVLTLAGVDVALMAVIHQAQTNWSNIGGDVLGLAAIAKIPQCLGLICGAMSARVTAWVATGASKWVTK